MKPSAFDYVRPKTVEEALAVKSLHPEARWLAGGQSLVPLMNMRLASPPVLVDLNGISSLEEIRMENGWLRIGALTRHSELITNATLRQHVPLLPLAARFIGHQAIRHRGTLGGSLAHADPSAELGLAMVALGGVMVVRGLTGDERDIPADQFFMGPLMTVLEAGELLVAVKIPLMKQAADWRFDEVSRRHGDFALVSAAVGKVGHSVRVAVGGVEGCPKRLREIEEWLNGTSHPAWDELRERVIRSLEPDTGDMHGSGWYRQQVAGRLVERLVREVVGYEK